MNIHYTQAEGSLCDEHGNTNQCKRISIEKNAVSNQLDYYSMCQP
jgi:hypothetical protein